MVKTLYVEMNGERVGELSLRQGSLVFSYAPQWLMSDKRRSLSRSLPVVQQEHMGNVVKNYFGNLLPDNPESIRKLSRNLSLDSVGIFEILEQIGRDCIGAVQLYPEDVSAKFPSSMEYQTLSGEEIESILQGLRGTPLGVHLGVDFRISLAGAQEKTALLKTADGWALPLRATPTTHMFKVPIGSLSGNQIDFPDSCENEWLCLKIAKAFGLPVVNAQMESFGRQRVLIVERFDRKRLSDGRILRLPTEDFCQALGVSSEKKYQSDGGPGIMDIMKILEKSAERIRDQHNFMAAQVLLWLINSTDGHAKNYSLFIGAGDSIRLTPFYDILSVEPLIASGDLSKQKTKLAMCLLGKNRHYQMDSVEPRHFMSTAKAVGYPLTDMRRTLQEFVLKVSRVEAELRAELPSNFPKSVSDPIFKVLRDRTDKIKNYLARECKEVT